MPIFRAIAFAILATLCRSGALAQVSPDDFAPAGFGLTSPAVPQPDGRILVLGTLNHPDGFSSSRIARLFPNGNPDMSFNPGADAEVRAVAVQRDGKLLVAGGSNSQIQGVPIRIIRLNSDGTPDPGFKLVSTGTITTLVAQPDGKILVGGTFSNLGGLAFNSLARLNEDGSIDTTFNAGVTGVATTAGTVATIAVQPDGKIVVGGTFDWMNGTNREDIGRLNADGTLDTGFMGGAFGSVHAVVVQPDGRIVVGGSFTTLAGASVSRLGRLNQDGSLDSSFNSSADGTVTSLALQADGGILVAGSFSQLNGELRRSCGKLNPDGTLDPDFKVIPEGSISAIFLQGDGNVLATGSFTEIQGEPRTRIARLRNTVNPISEITVDTTVGRVEWIRGGSCPETFSVDIEFWNGSAWTGKTAAARVAGGWRATGFALPSSGWVRATALLHGESGNRCSSFEQRVVRYGREPAPDMVILGEDGSALSHEPAELVFGSARLGQVAGPRVLSILNAGDAPLENLVVEFVGQHAGDFSCTVPVLPALAPGQSTTIGIQFAPRSGLARLAELRISANDPGKTPFAISLEGMGSLLDEDFDPNANGAVTTILEQSGGRLLLGGSFTEVGGKPRSALARLDANGLPEAGFAPEANGNVNAMFEQPDGGIVISGSFTQIAGQNRSRLARLMEDGTLDPVFTPSAGSTVNCLAVDEENRIVVGGQFTTLAGQTRRYIGRLNGDGSADMSFNPDANSFVNAIVRQSDGKILVGGQFTTMGGVGRTYLARLLPDGTPDSGFNPAVNNAVQALAVQPDGKILVGGQFTSIAGGSRERIARLNPSGTLDTSFNPGANDTVYSLTLDASGRILVSGQFTQIGARSQRYFARLAPDGVVDSELNVTPGLTVSTVMIQTDGRIVLGGSFTTINNQTRNRIARMENRFPATRELIFSGGDQIDWQIGGSSPELRDVSFDLWNASGWTRLAAGFRVSGGWRATGVMLPPQGWVRARGRTGQGRFSGSSNFVTQSAGFGGISIPRISVRPAGGEPLTPGRGVLDFGDVGLGQTAGPLEVMVTNEGDAPLSGLAVALRGTEAADFSVQGFPSPGLAPGEMATIRIFFTPQATGPRGAELLITSNQPDSGSFLIQMKGNAPLTDEAFSPEADYDVYALAMQPDGGILVGGNFSNLNGESRPSLGRLLPDGSLDPAFRPSPSGSVNAIIVQPDGRILVGGSFVSMAGSSKLRAARLKEDGTIDDTFTPAFPNNTINCLALQADGKILIGGIFTLLEGQSVTRIARLNPDGSFDSSFNPGANGTIHTLLVQADGRILVGGEFTTLGGQSRERIARLLPDGSLDASFNPGANGIVSVVHELPDGSIVVGGSFTTVGGVGRARIARLFPDGTVDPGFNPDSSGPVSTLALRADGRMIVGGTFYSMGGKVRYGLAVLLPDGTVDANLLTRANDSILALALQPDGGILMGGSFTTIDGQARSRLARLDSPTPAASVLTITPGGQIDWARGGSAPELQSVHFETWNGSSWIGKTVAFRTVGGWRATAMTIPASGWIRAAGTSIGGRGSASSGLISMIKAHGSDAFPEITVLDEGGNPLTGGAGIMDFGSLRWGYQSPPRTLVIRNTGDATLTGLSASIIGLHPEDFTHGALATDILDPGQFTTLPVSFSPKGESQRAALLRITSNDADRNPVSIALTGIGIVAEQGLVPVFGSTSQPCWNIADLSSGQILVGGSFTSIAGRNLGGLARFEPEGALDGRFNLFLDDDVQTILEQDDGRIILGGEFLTSGLQSAVRLLRINPDGSRDPTFLGYATGSVEAMAIQPDGRILVAGEFLSLGTTSRPRIGRLLANGSVDPTFNPRPDNTVYSIALQNDSRILIGGWFTKVGGQNRNRIARLNPDGNLDMSFDPGANNIVLAVLPQPDGRILVAGQFSSIAGHTRACIARLNPDGSIDPAFNPGADGSIYSLALQSDGRILVGGNFTTIGGQARSRIARLNPDGSVDGSFAADANDSVFSLYLQSDGRILTCGKFGRLAGETRSRFGRLENNTAATWNLMVSNGDTVEMQTGGSFPALVSVRFEVWNGSGWTSLGGAPGPAGSWRAEGLSLPPDGWIRAVGRRIGGMGTGASTTIRKIAAFGSGNLPDIEVRDETSTDLVSSQSALDFGQVAIGSTASRHLSLRNGGAAPLLIHSIVCSGSGFGVPSFGPHTLAPGESVVVPVLFEPVLPGNVGGSLVISSNDGDESPFSLSLAGTSVNHPMLTVEQPLGSPLVHGSEARFGVITPDQSVPKVLTLRNNSLGSLELSGIVVSGPQSRDFQIIKAGTATHIPPGGTTGLLVIFNPSGNGASFAELAISSNDPNHNPYRIRLRGGALTAVLPERPNLPILTRVPSGPVGIVFRGSPAATHTVLRSTDLHEWTAIAELEADAAGTLFFVDESPPGDRAFYRFSSSN